MSKFPIDIRLPNGYARDLSMAEEGSYEDMSTYEESGRARPLEGHAHIVSKRWDGGLLEILNIEEATDVYYAVCSGTFQSEDAGHFRAACKIANVLRPIVIEHDPSLVKQWPAPWDTRDVS